VPLNNRRGRCAIRASARRSITRERPRNLAHGVEWTAAPWLLVRFRQRWAAAIPRGGPYSSTRRKHGACCARRIPERVFPAAVAFGDERRNGRVAQAIQAHARRPWHPGEIVSRDASGMREAVRKGDTDMAIT